MGMRRSIMAWRLLFLAATALSACVCRANAEKELNARLKSSGLRLGFEGKSRRIVAIGTAERELADPSGVQDFGKIRNDLGKLAIVDAKREVAQIISQNINASDRVELTADGDVRKMMLVSVVRSFAQAKLVGCRVIASAESYEGGVYQVAVAMGWSELARTHALNALSPGHVSLDVMDDSEWTDWFDRNDASVMVGSRCFTGKDGKLRFVGLAAMDVDGLSGIKLKSAMRAAGCNALGNLAFALYADVEAKDVAIRALREIEVGGNYDSFSWAAFTREVSNSCNRKMLRAREVYSTTFRHPVSGRVMYLSAYGITFGMDKEKGKAI